MFMSNKRALAYIETPELRVYHRAISAAQEYERKRRKYKRIWKVPKG